MSIRESLTAYFEGSLIQLHLISTSLSPLVPSPAYPPDFSLSVFCICRSVTSNNWLSFSPYFSQPLRNCFRLSYGNMCHYKGCPMNTPGTYQVGHSNVHSINPSDATRAYSLYQSASKRGNTSIISEITLCHRLYFLSPFIT